MKSMGVAGLAATGLVGSLSTSAMADEDDFDWYESNDPSFDPGTFRVFRNFGVKYHDSFYLDLQDGGRWDHHFYLSSVWNGRFKDDDGEVHDADRVGTQNVTVGSPIESMEFRTETYSVYPEGGSSLSLPEPAKILISNALDEGLPTYISYPKSVIGDLGKLSNEEDDNELDLSQRHSVADPWYQRPGPVSDGSIFADVIVEQNIAENTTLKQRVDFNDGEDIWGDPINQIQLMIGADGDLRPLSNNNLHSDESIDLRPEEMSEGLWERFEVEEIESDELSGSPSLSLHSTDNSTDPTPTHRANFPIKRIK